MAHIREIKFRYVPKFSITKNIRFYNQKKIANNLVKYLKKLKYLKINNWVVKPASSGKTGKSYQKGRYTLIFLAAPMMNLLKSIVLSV